MPKPVHRSATRAKVLTGDMRELSLTLPDSGFDSVVTDPPYELGFMGKAWDRSGVAFDPDTWRSVLRVLRPGGYMLCFGGARTYHRLTCAVEDAGFEVRDCLMWIYGTGFPKGEGCLKPAWEPVLLARKPGKRVLPLSIDVCRVPTNDKLGGGAEGGTRADQKGHEGWTRPWMSDPLAREAHAARVRENVAKAETMGRYPANVVHDGSDEVMEAFAAFGERNGGHYPKARGGGGLSTSGHAGQDGLVERNSDTGTAARFFYCAKASKAERGEDNTHPTVKPLSLMRWLVRLVTPPAGKLLDPFAGSGTTLLAARQEGMSPTGIELEESYATIARERLKGHGYAEAGA